MRNQISILKRLSQILLLLPFAAMCAGQEPVAQQAQASASEGPAPLRVMVGKSLLINTTDRLKRVSVTDPQEEIKLIFPEEQIEVSPSRSAIVLSGHVTTEDVAKHAGQVAGAYSKNVINVLSFGPIGAQEVLLEVKFAEVDRSAVTQLGVNAFSPGIGNTVGTSTTGQFGGFQVSRGTTTTTGETSGSQTNINLNQALNLFLFRTDINL